MKYLFVILNYFSMLKNNNKRLILWLIFSVITILQAKQAISMQLAYIPNLGSNNVSVIDTITNNVIKTISVGANPFGAAVNTAGTRVYVTNSYAYSSGGSVSVIDTATNSVINTIPVGLYPLGIAVNSTGTRVYVANNFSAQPNLANISVIDTSTNTVIGTIPVGNNARNIALNPSGSRAYVSHGYGQGVTVIDTLTNTVIKKINIAGGGYTEGIVSNPSGTRVYVSGSDYTNNLVWVIDTTTDAIINSITLPLGNTCVTINPSGTRLYVTSSGGSNPGYVYVIDTATNTLIKSISVSNSYGISITPSGSRVYVAEYSGSGIVAVIDTATNTVVESISVGDAPLAFGQFIGEIPIVTANLSTGSNVSVTPYSGVTLTFNNVSNVGTVSVTQPAGPSPPANFRVITGSSYNITSTASYSGYITIALSYSDSALVDKNNEGKIKLFHHNGQNWEDVTTSVDTVNNIVYGRVTSLSPFILAEPIAPTSGIPATPVGGLGMSLVTMLSIAGYGFWKSRK